MAIRSLDYLKGKFEDGDRPTGADFSDLVESTLNSSITSLSASGVEKLRVFSEGVSAVGNLYTTGDINVDGNITAKGTLTLGDADTDNVTFNADVNSNVLPDANNTYNLGSSGRTWGNVYGHNLSAYNILEAGQDIILNGTSIQDTYVDVSGDTMTGSLSTINLSAAEISTTGNILSAGVDLQTLFGTGLNKSTADSYYVNVSGDTMTGALSAPTLSATKVEVNGNIKLGNSGGGSQLQYDTTNFYISDLRNNGRIRFGVLNGKVAIGGTDTIDGEDVTVTGSSYLSGNVTTTGSISAASTIKTDSTLSATKVDVNGNIKLGNGGGGGQLQYNTTNFYIADLTNDAIRLSIINGNVGVGTTDVQEKLTVAGTVSAAGFKTDGSTGVTTNVTITATDAGTKTLTIKNGIIVSVA